MKSPKVKTSAKNTAGPRGVRFKEDNGSGLDGSYPITQGPENPPAPASYSSEDDEASTSGIFIHSSTNPSASVSFGTNLFPLTSTFGQSPHPNFSPFVPSTSTHPAFTSEANSFAPFGKFNPCGLQAPAYINMADYQNVAPPAGGLHFQPPVPDTTYGPMQHVYVPRFDNGMAPGGLYHVGLPQTQVTPISPALFVPQTTPAFIIVPSVVNSMQAAMYSYQGSAPLGASVQQSPPSNITYIGQAPPANPPIMVAQQPVIQPGISFPSPPIMLQGPAVAMSGPPTFQGHTPMGLNMAPGMGGGGVPVFAGNTGLPPDVTGFGKTAGEVAMEQAQFAYANGLFEPQDFKPADDDPSRYYPVREVDGNWTQRNRFTIDNLGDCRWYVTNEGYFYAVRLPN
ncbi:hypothetical protein CPLU01_03902 [Colletotrichum plurivorum]|uniref:Uncharacterized protein n=1 Tax=Colletotrichum plurivorum TaxID=2175906 RepID=A0A8H6NJK3_9PEZI|nr:hypothetical protein CPLU01_03902 [Colletotrichum plurivorum]